MASNAIDNLMVPDGASIFYNPAFRVVLEDHMTYFRGLSDNNLFPVTPHQVYKYRFDLGGLMLDLGIALQYHWIVMRVNNITDMTHVPPDLTVLVMPAQKNIDVIAQTHKTISK
jgi:hypothetical protein